LERKIRKDKKEGRIRKEGRREGYRKKEGKKEE
jgi:hypothetical protein